MNIKILIRVFMIFMVVVCLQASAFSEEKKTTVSSEISFNMLLPPASPGFLLLGKAPSAVERPGNAADFALNILSQTDNLSKIPDNFAIEFAPYWIFKGRDLSFDDYKSNNIWKSILQTMSFSVAQITEQKDDAESTGSNKKLGLGIRFSILRGNIQNEIDDKIMLIRQKQELLLKKISPEYLKLIKEDPMIKKLIENSKTATEEQKSMIALEISKREDEIKKPLLESAKTEIADIKKEISAFRLKRIGLKLDCAAGMAFNFFDNNFDNGKLEKSGVWLTGGYEGNSVSILGVARFLGNSQDENSLDLGGRLVIDNIKNIAFSGEVVFRRLYKENANSSSWRYALVVDYQLGQNKNLTFSLGRDFKGNKTGNLISMINLIFGFGTNRGN